MAGSALKSLTSAGKRFHKSVSFEVKEAELHKKKKKLWHSYERNSELREACEAMAIWAFQSQLDKHVIIQKKSKERAIAFPQLPTGKSLVKHNGAAYDLHF